MHRDQISKSIIDWQLIDISAEFEDNKLLFKKKKKLIEMN